MSHKVIVTKEIPGYIRVGTILHDAVLHDDCWWVGTIIDRASACAPTSICEIWDEEKHDPNMWFIRKHLKKKLDKSA